MRSPAAPLRGVLIACLITACMFSACTPQRTPQHFLLPDGFTGWAYVKYDDPSCAPLEVRDGRQLVRIPPNGRLCTSTRYETGFARDLWEYVNQDGTTRSLEYETEISLASFHEPGHFKVFLVGAARGATPDPSPFR